MGRVQSEKIWIDPIRPYSIYNMQGQWKERFVPRRFFSGHYFLILSIEHIRPSLGPKCDWKTAVSCWEFKPLAGMWKKNSKMLETKKILLKLGCKNWKMGSKKIGMNELWYASAKIGHLPWSKIRLNYSNIYWISCTFNFQLSSLEAIVSCKHEFWVCWL